MKSLILIAALLLTLPGSAWTGVGTQGQGIQSADRSPFLNALGGTTAGKALFQLANPGAITFLRVNADNSVSALNATDFKTAIGATSSAWGAITGTLASQTDLNSALALKAPLVSPALTGTPTLNGTPIGTAATTASTAYATAAQGRVAFTAPLRIACVGTSITAAGSTFDTTANPRIHDVTNGYSSWLEHLSDHRVKLTRRYGNNGAGADKSFGMSGWQLTGIIDGALGIFPTDDAIASGPEVMVMEGGTNDISGGDRATIVSKITSYWTKAVSAGKKVIALNVLPQGGQALNSTVLVNGDTYEIYVPGNTVWTSFGAANSNTGTVFVKSGSAATGTGIAISKSSATAFANRDLIANVNSDLVGVASSLGVTLIDTHAADLLTKTNGFASVEAIADSVHPTPAYAHRLAVKINEQLAPMYAYRPMEMMVPNGYRNTVTAGSFVTGQSYKIVTAGSPSLGTAGTVFTAASAGTGTGTALETSPLWITPSNSPSQSTIPAGWANYGTGMTATYSATSDNWQRVRLLLTGTPLGDNNITIRVTTGFTAGDRVRFSCRIRPVAAATFSCWEFAATGRTTADYSSWTYFRAISGGSNLGTGDYDPITGWFISPVYTIPAGHVGMDAIISFYNTDVTFDITQFGIYKMPVIENP